MVGSGIRHRHILRVDTTRLPTALIIRPAARLTFSPNLIGTDTHQTHRTWRITHIPKRQDHQFPPGRQQSTYLFNGARVPMIPTSNTLAHPSGQTARFRKALIYTTDTWLISISPLARSTRNAC